MRHPFYYCIKFFRNWGSKESQFLLRSYDSNRMNVSEIVILGAGPTGLSAAYHLEQAGFFDYQLFEKDATSGGLCRSVSQDGFTFDYTGHLLHVNDAYFAQFIAEVVGLQNFHQINRRSYIYSHNTYTHYPFQVNLHGLPQEVIIECIEGFVNRPEQRTKPSSFYQWALRMFGSGIAKHFFFPYQRKIFAYDIKKLSTSWTGRFVPSTSLSQMLKGAFQAPDPSNSIGYNAQFLYPKQAGISFWVDKLANALHNKALINHEVTEVDVAQKTVTFANGNQVSYTHLISTIPLDILLSTLKEPSRLQVKRARSHLLCNAVINFNLGVNHAHLSDKHWIYFPEKSFPFYRIGFPHNFAPASAPPGHSCLYGEISYLPGKPVNKKKLLDAALHQTKQLLHLSENDIATELIITIPHAYVIYNHWRDRNITKILRRLGDYNIYSVGRYGAWKYASMQEALLDGKAIVQQLLPPLLKKEADARILSRS